MTNFHLCIITKIRRRAGGGEPKLHTFLNLALMRSESSTERTGCLILELTVQIDRWVSESRARHHVKRKRRDSHSE